MSHLTHRRSLRPGWRTGHFRGDPACSTRTVNLAKLAGKNGKMLWGLVGRYSWILLITLDSYNEYMKPIKNVDEYIALAPKEVQGRLKELRATIMAAAPNAKERISYGMPYYEYKGRLVYFQPWKSLNRPRHRLRRASSTGLKFGNSLR